MKATSILLSFCIAIVASAARAELENENLLAKLPAGFKIDFQQKNKDMLINEMVPVGETVNNWTEMVTVQVFYNLNATPDQFKGKMEAGMAAACPGSESHEIAQGDENGYPSIVWLQSCPLNVIDIAVLFLAYRDQPTLLSTFVSARALMQIGRE
jgi:hypothetical protein